MAERPILFSGDMIRAYFSSRKTVTRRVLFFEDPNRPVLTTWDPVHGRATFMDSIPDDPCPLDVLCPHGTEGDYLYVRETFILPSKWDKVSPKEAVALARQRGEVIMPKFPGTDPTATGRRRPGIHLPRELSRAKLELLDVRVERVQQITEEDAIAEGVASRAEFASLWDRINGSRFRGGATWAKNPWTWRLEFPPFTEDKRSL